MATPSVGPLLPVMSGDVTAGLALAKLDPPVMSTVCPPTGLPYVSSTVKVIGSPLECMVSASVAVFPCGEAAMVATAAGLIVNELVEPWTLPMVPVNTAALCAAKEVTLTVAWPPLNAVRWFTVNAFAFGDVVEAITRKMIRRHPHVFADKDGNIQPAGVKSAHLPT